MRILRCTVLALALASSACQTLSGADPSAEPLAERPVLVVTNENFSDVDIHIVRSGTLTRLGRVNAGATQRFVLSPTQIGPGDVSFRATQSNGGGRASTGSLIVGDGQTVNFRIAAVLNQSVTSVR